MILLVAEKPSVANQHYRPMLERLEGEKFTQGDGCLIGKNHCITWCVGHRLRRWTPTPALKADGDFRTCRCCPKNSD